MRLVIVESPTKARKLVSYLGSDFVIEASVGHIRDLPKSGLGIDLDNNFTPQYTINSDKTKVVSHLKSAAKKASDIILATDPDREGEAIAWHLQVILDEAAGAKKKLKISRASFNEITKQAVLAALEKPQAINHDLVDAQQARRVVDRLVGYKLSPVLWKKIRRGLSAGRVQSVALRLIAEREREIEQFVPDEYWEVGVALDSDLSSGLKASGVEIVLSESGEGGEKSTTKKTSAPRWLAGGKLAESAPSSLLFAKLVSINAKTYKPTKQGDADPVVSDLSAPTTSYRVESVERKERKRSSLPPFTTSTLQQASANRLGFTSKQTMRLAQQLYEEGLITYHRTDSVALSGQSLAMARTYIESAFGQRYLPEKPRFFASKSKNAQEAHEAIRVTKILADPSQVLRESGRFNNSHQRLFDLIQRRFLASQMEQAIYDQTSVTVNAKPTSGSTNYQLRSGGSVLRFDGWMKLFPAGDDTILPDVETSQDLNYLGLEAVQKFTQPPPRYNDASLVKELEKRGIGRPSTYASIISVIEDRGYVERLDKRFIATPVGLTVSDFLLKHFEKIVDYDFTADMEEDLDRIARGEKQWQNLVGDFYGEFAKKVEEVEQVADRAKVPVEETGEKCPQCSDGQVVIRSGRFGKFKSCSSYPECDYTQNLVETVDGVKCPLCQEGDVIARKTRWGKLFYGCRRYPACDWASWKKPAAGDKITAKEWAAHQAERKERQAKRAATMEAKKAQGKTKSATKAKTKTKTKSKASAKPKSKSKSSATARAKSQSKSAAKKK